MMRTSYRGSLDPNIDPNQLQDFLNLSQIPLQPAINETNTPAEKPETVPYYKLFRYTSGLEKLYVFIGVIFACIASIGMPFSLILYGEYTTLLVDRSTPNSTTTKAEVLSWFGGGAILQSNSTKEETFAATMDDAVAFGVGTVVCAIINFVFIALSIQLLNYVAQNQITKIRKLFFKSVLKQDMTWYDLNTSENFAVRMTEDLEKLKKGIGEKLSIFIFLIMVFVLSVIASFVYGWKLTLVTLSCAPIIVIATAVGSKMQSQMAEKELQAYSEAGTVAEETLGAIRTVVAFGGEQNELKRYGDRLIPAEICGKKKGSYSGVGNGIMYFVIFCCFSLALWYGITLILEDFTLTVKEYTPAVLVIVMFGVVTGAQNLGFSAPYVETFSSACGSASSIFKIIDRVPEIDSISDVGIMPTKLVGNIKFENVSFRYPARQDVKVLNGLNLEIQAGTSVALVGPSGCGKSTCLQLIQHLYDPIGGSVYIDGIYVKAMNTKSLRKNIGLVGQEPILFAATIMENIKYGNPKASVREIEKACKIANCHQFIAKLPMGYNTIIGERGAALSGGQKQRIAIARALVRNPNILLLDEATSALDPTSEKQVQDAIDRASKGRTTVSVTHRLSTIVNVNKIVYIDKGKVLEEGTHAELMEKKGAYYELVMSNHSEPPPAQRDSHVNMRMSHRSSHRVSHRISHRLSHITELDSDSESEIEGEDEERELDENSSLLGANKKPKQKSTFLRILKLNGKEWPFIVSGIIGSFLVGVSFPVFALIFGEIYGVLSSTDTEYIRNEANMYAIYFLILGIAAGLGAFLQAYMFTYAGVYLTSRLRSMTFKSMMAQEMAWFDDEKNAVGALCARLAGDCAAVQGATGSQIGAIIQAVATVVSGLILSFIYSWKLTLVASTCFPAVIIAVIIESRMMEKSEMEESAAIENATRMAVEAISNIRTVASLNQEIHVYNRYSHEIEKVHVLCNKKNRFRGLVFGIGQTIPLAGYALSLWYGGYLVAHHEIDYKNVIKIGEALIFSSMILGQALAYAPNLNTAISSGARILKLVDRKPKMKNPEPFPGVSYQSDGSITYKNVFFRYPTRKTVPVLEGLNLEIKSGTTVALVGPSGCGKSTCMQLIMRYYDPDSGRVELSGRQTIEYPIHKIRSTLGLVSQEPILFDRTIAENIAYGDLTRDIPMNEIFTAAKNANIHEFILKLPSGYATRLGAKGCQLSGGQKQRIAIARALVRNPKILLLDEATSALDNTSEKVVQAALDKARTGRTCVTIAHRLTTVQNADVIVVFEAGQVVEKGTHEELMMKGKKYAKLYKMQQISH